MPNPPELEYLFTLTATLREPVAVMGAPQGSRMVFAVTGGSFEGPRLRGTVDNSGGDWLTRRADGSIKLDVRALLHTEDGAAIYMAYTGIGVQKDGEMRLRTAPLFETGDPRYTWLNNLQAIGSGKGGDGRVSYDVFALPV